MYINPAIFAATVAGPIDFLLDTNAVAFIGVFTVLVGVSLPWIAVRAGGRRKRARVHQQRRPSIEGEYYRNMRFPTVQTAEPEIRASSFAGLGPDEHGINRASTNLASEEIFQVSAARRFTSGAGK